MKHLSQYGAVLTAAVFLCLSAGEAPAQTALAQNNATVQPGGPRTGPNGLAFFNVEGAANGANASYGVLEFNSPDLGYGQVSAVTSLTVALLEDEASFTAKGPLEFYVTTDTTTSILNDGTSPLIFDAADPQGLNGQLQTLYTLGNGKFHPIRTGHVDTYRFSVTPGSALEAYLINQINTGDIIRVVIAPRATTAGQAVGATWAGYTNTIDNSAPALTVVAQ